MQDEQNHEHRHLRDAQDRDGARPVLHRLQDDCPRLRVVWGDGGYWGPKLGDWVQEQGIWHLQIVHRDPDAAGFKVVPKRWIVERTFARLGCHHRPGKDYAGRVDSSASWIHIAMARCMLKRLASV